MLTTEVKRHLETNIIPFWQGMKDELYGGFYGFLDFDLNLDKGLYFKQQNPLVFLQCLSGSWRKDTP